MKLQEGHTGRMSFMWAFTGGGPLILTLCDYRSVTKRGKRSWWCLQLGEGHTQQQQQQSGHQHGGAGGQSPCSVVVETPVAVAPVGPVTVVTKAAHHLGPGAAALRLLTETLVGAGLQHRV